MTESCKKCRSLVSVVRSFVVGFVDERTSSSSLVCLFVSGVALLSQRPSSLIHRWSSPSSSSSSFVVVWSSLVFVVVVVIVGVVVRRSCFFTSGASTFNRHHCAVVVAVAAAVAVAIIAALPLFPYHPYRHALIQRQQGRQQG